MFFFIVLTPISTTSGLGSTGNTRKYHQIDVYIYRCVTSYNLISDSHVQREDSDAFQNISDDIEVEASYRGVHLTFPLTLNQLHKMVQAFRRKQVSNLMFFLSF